MPLKRMSHFDINDSYRHHHLAILHPYLVRPYLQPARHQRDPGGDIKLNPVPGAGDDFAVADPGELPVRGGGAGGGAVDGALAEGAELVRADVRQGVQLAVDVEDANGDAAKLHHLVAARREVAQRAGVVLCHA